MLSVCVHVNAHKVHIFEKVRSCIKFTHFGEEPFVTYKQAYAHVYACIYMYMHVYKCLYGF